MIHGAENRDRAYQRRAGRIPTLPIYCPKPALDGCNCLSESFDVFKRTGQLLLTLALVAAIGGHWALLQTVAWTSMFAENLRESSFTRAVTKTFDGNHPCKLCHAISEGKKSEKKTEFQFGLKKLEFTIGHTAFGFYSPQEFRLLPDTQEFRQCRTLAPPLPPPRPAIA